MMMLLTFRKVRGHPVTVDWGVLCARLPGVAGATVGATRLTLSATFHWGLCIEKERTT